jgi:threonine aldolase
VMFAAEVGDDVLDGDPTVRTLEERVAALLGKEAALFFPSGTMANQTALWCAGERGTEVLLDHRAHILEWEQAGAAALSGMQVRPLTPGGAALTADDLRRGLRPASRHAPRASVLALENTLNGGGGSILPLDDASALAALAHAHGLHVHLDGARLWNAHVATRTPLDLLAAPYDSVMVSFSKGLGAPVGAALAGSRTLIDRAWEVRKRLGGGMRQSGFLAAAALHGITHHLPRLVHDHEHAAAFARRVHGAGGAQVAAPDTNIVMIDLPPDCASAEIVAAATAHGVGVTAWHATRLRAVFHLDVSTAQAATAAEALVAILANR